jgi:hypothetical protein
LIQGAQLWDWDGGTAHPEFDRLTQSIRQMLGEESGMAGTTEHVISKPVQAKRPGFAASYGRALVIVAAIVVVLLLSKFVFQSVDRSAEQQGNTGSTGSSSSERPSSPDSGASGTVPDGAFSIAIGERIDRDVPAAGAGMIAKPYEEDHYVFTARPGQLVYFRKLRHDRGLDYIQWRLVDSNGEELFNTCLGCTEAGLHTLTRGGTYILTVGADRDASTGSYQLQLYDVPPPGKFPIKIGDAVTQNQPAAGAGAIEVPGAHDVYTFTAGSQQRVYFRLFEHSRGTDYIQWRLADEDNMEVFSTCLGCTEPGVQTLNKDGAYTLTVGNRTDPSTGTYRFQLFDVPPPNQFTIRIGDRIRRGSPGSGAGVIESPGAEDVYVFSAAAGRQVYVRLLERSPGMDYINWQMVDENGMEVFKTCLGCTEPGVQTLVRGGRYTLRVGNAANPSTGTYAFEIGSR